MRFREKLESFRLETLLNDDNNQEEKKNDLKTIEGIRAENEQLLERLSMLEKIALEGVDVTNKLRRLEEKFELITQIGELLDSKSKVIESASKSRANKKDSTSSSWLS